MQILEILNRVSTVIKSNKNIDIAKALDTKPTTVSSWKDRNTIPWENLWEFSHKNKVSLDWLITGKEKDLSDSDLPPDNITDSNWTLHALIYEMQQQIKEQRNFNNKINESILIKKKTHLDIWDAINRQQSMLNNIMKVLMHIGKDGNLSHLNELSSQRTK